MTQITRRKKLVVALGSPYLVVGLVKGPAAVILYLVLQALIIEGALSHLGWTVRAGMVVCELIGLHWYTNLALQSGYEMARVEDRVKTRKARSDLCGME